jgi:hypothetical protein
MKKRLLAYTLTTLITTSLLAEPVWAATTSAPLTNKQSTITAVQNKPTTKVVSKSTAPVTNTQVAKTSSVNDNTDELPSGEVTGPLTVSKFAKEYQDAKMISLAVGACAGTYTVDTKAYEYEYLGDYGWKIAPQTVKDGNVTANFMIATHPSYSDGSSMGIIAFRGSSSVGDWVQDFKYNMVNYGGNTVADFKKVAASPAWKSDMPKVHKGFHEYVMSAFNLNTDLDLNGQKDDLVQMLKARPHMTLLVTGHSLGGAAATLFAERLVALGVPKKQIEVITFGAPAIGNTAFVDKYGDKINLIRVRTTHDPVPGVLKLTGAGYKQFGEKVLFPVSLKYSDMTHHISYYFDGALKHYYDLRDQGVKAGYLAPIPDKVLHGSGPLVAVLVTRNGLDGESEFSPSVLELITNEYKSILPRYVMLPQSPIGGIYTLNNILSAAAKVNADFVIAAEAGIKNADRKGHFYTNISQGVFDVPSGNMIAMSTSGSQLKYEQGVVQTAMYTMENCKKDLKEKLTFLDKFPPREWH